MSTHPHAALAAHRFGLGEPDLTAIGADPRGWLRQQIGPADPQVGAGAAAMPGSVAAMLVQDEARRQVASAGRDDLRDELRKLVQGDVRARLVTASTTRRPFTERLAMFWTNHFTVAGTKGSTRGLVGAFEREAIRPHVAGRFVDLLSASTTHVAMHRFLDNQLSAGPNSRVVQRLAARSREATPPTPARLTGLNENLARELLELHTLGASAAAGRHGPWGGYNQADVTSVAAVLTGWRGAFDANWHEPGEKTVLNNRYSGGQGELGALLLDLSREPATARFIATKLARYFVADDPPPALVNALAAAFSASDGDLPTVYRALIDSPLAWVDSASKLKTPEEFVVSTARLLRLGDKIAARAADAGVGLMGQRLHATPSPAGWPDQAQEWLGPEAVWQRIEWSARLAERIGSSVDARALAEASLGPLLGPATRQQIDRAADAPQALALLLMSPEFQRR